MKSSSSDKERAPTKVNCVYSLDEVKECLDLNLKEYLTSSLNKSQKYKEVFQYQDIKILLNIILVIIAAGSFYIDKKLDFHQSINTQALLIIGYIIVSGLYWGFTKFVEKDTLFIGISSANKGSTVKHQSSNHKLYVKSAIDTEHIKETQPNKSPVYKMEYTFSSERGSGEKNVVHTDCDVTRLFSENGDLQTAVFYDLVESSISKKLE
ncbi:hypothetical protein ACO0QE_001858 [Hanseniaspora vineae]